MLVFAVLIFMYREEVTLSTDQFSSSGYGFKTVLHEFPVFLFIIASIIMSWFAIRKRLSLIPVMGLLTNFYLMAQLGTTNWLRFLMWLALGLIIYFSYGRRHSRLFR
jgi:hypothetical protein